MTSIKKLETQVKRLKSRCKKLEQLAYHDALTGAHNRRSFLRYINGKVSRNRKAPFSLIFIDINRFKKYNDTLGHIAGDKLLLLLVKEIEKLTKHPDRLFRFAGDEFILVTNKIGSELTTFKNKIGLEVKEQLPISISLGSAQFPKDSKKIEGLIEKADKNMYKAKQQFY